MPPTAWPLPREVREIETLIEPLGAATKDHLALHKQQIHAARSVKVMSSEEDVDRAHDEFDAEVSGPVLSR